MHSPKGFVKSISSAGPLFPRFGRLAINALKIQCPSSSLTLLQPGSVRSCLRRSHRNPKPSVSGDTIRNSAWPVPAPLAS